MKCIVISGTCGTDAETRQTQSGSSVTSVSVAVNGFANGEKTTEWFDVSMWGKRGEAMKQFATKGSRITFSGDFSTRMHNDKTYLQVNAQDFTPGQSAQMGHNSDSQHQNSGPSGSQAPAQQPIDSDSIPF